MSNSDTSSDVVVIIDFIRIKDFDLLVNDFINIDLDVLRFVIETSFLLRKTETRIKYIYSALDYEYSSVDSVRLINALNTNLLTSIFEYIDYVSEYFCKDVDLVFDSWSKDSDLSAALRLRKEK